MVPLPALCPARAGESPLLRCWSNGGVGGATTSPLFTSRRLPVGAYSAERGRSDGGTKDDLTPTFSAGGRNDDEEPLVGVATVEVERGVVMEGESDVGAGLKVGTGVGREVEGDSRT